MTTTAALEGDPRRAERRETSTGSSTARRCGRPSRTGRSGASCSRALRRGPNATTDWHICLCRWTSRESRSGRSSSSPATSEFNEVFFTDARPRPAWWSVSPVTAGGWRWARCSSSAASPRWASRSVMPVSFPASSSSPRTPVPSTIRRSGTGSPGPGPACRRCARSPWQPWTTRMAFSPPEKTRFQSCCGPTGIATSASSPSTSRASPVWSQWGGEFDEWQRLFLFSRADTIYGDPTRSSA